MKHPILDLGDGHTAQAVELNGVVYGYDITHPRKGQSGERCASWIPIGGGPESWTVDSPNPLTVSPSLLCTACGDHGFIRQGQWVPA